MIRLCALASGSRGNSFLVQGARSALLVDAGLSARELRRRMGLVGFDPAGLVGIVLTHEHGDHIRGAGVLARSLGLPIHANTDTLEAGRAVLGKLPEVRPFRTSEAFRVGEFHIHPFPVSHDAADPVGLVVEAEGIRVGFCQDCGIATRLVRERLRHMDALVLEHNHDPGMLTSGPYPWSTKQRIRSRHGHLSNDEGARLLAELAHPGLRGVFLAHLSETNNLPELADLAAREALREAGLPEELCHVACQHRPSPVLEIRGSDGVPTKTE